LKGIRDNNRSTRIKLIVHRLYFNRNSQFCLSYMLWVSVVTDSVHGNRSVHPGPGPRHR